MKLKGSKSRAKTEHGVVLKPLIFFDNQLEQLLPWWCWPVSEMLVRGSKAGMRCGPTQTFGDRSERRFVSMTRQEAKFKISKLNLLTLYLEFNTGRAKVRRLKAWIMQDIQSFRIIQAAQSVQLIQAIQSIYSILSVINIQLYEVVGCSFSYQK